VTETPDDLVAIVRADAVLEVDVERVVSVLRRQALRIDEVVIGEQGEFLVVGQGASPTTQQVAAHELEVLPSSYDERWREDHRFPGRSGLAVEEVTLDCERVALARAPVRAETALTAREVVRGVAARVARQSVALEPLQVIAKRTVVAEEPTMANGRHAF